MENVARRATLSHQRREHGRTAGKFTTRLVPFADAGMMGERFKIWLPLAGQPGQSVARRHGKPLASGRTWPARSTTTIFKRIVTTFDGKPAAEDWFAVTLSNRPATAKRVVFTPGKTFHDGGWFDTSAGKPRVQIQRATGGAWETIGELGDYPTTTAAVGKFAWDKTQFTLNLTTPVTFIALRVIGVPASGDNPQQAFSSCAELQVFSK